MRLLVAGIPRCGTTLIYNSLRRDSGVLVAKTHSFYADPWKQLGFGVHRPEHETPFDFRHPTEDMKVIFMFGDIVNAVLSTKRKSRNTTWSEVHTRNCGFRVLPSDPLPPYEIFVEDHLNYEKIFDNWFATKRYPVLFLRYETLFNYNNELNKFTGSTVRLPPKRCRETKPQVLSKKTIECIESTYLSLIKKVNDLPDMFCHNN